MVAMLSGCAMTRTAGDSGGVNDPFESYNRDVFDGYLVLDRNALRPAAEGYRAVVPQPVRVSLRNLLQNLDSPSTFANDVLRGRVAPAGTTLGRFIINSTIGIGGLFEVADRFGLKRHSDDFGKTLATYGVGEGPYLFFVLFGPTNLRDVTGSMVDFFFNPFIIAGWTDWSIAVSGGYALTILDARAVNLELFDDAQRTSIDFYATVRDAYEQSRRSEIREEEGGGEVLPEF
jgi:phospholipid-binding lipoprotein MlaA